MSEKTKKRFIAGATCPKCQKLDTLMLFMQNNVEQIECIQCGYHEAQTTTEVKKASRQQEQVIGVFKPQ